MIEQDRRKCLYAWHAGRALRIGLRLFLFRMRRVVRTDDVDHAVRHGPPQRLAMALVADRRVHLRERAEPLIAIGCREREMLRRRFDRHEVLVAGKECHLLCRRHMKNMHAAAGLACECDDALRRPERDLLVAPDWMHRDVGTFAHQLEPLAQARLVLGMDGASPAAAAQHQIERLVVGDQQAAGRTAHENLDAATARQPLERCKLVDIVLGRAGEEGEVAPGPAGRTPHLVLDRGHVRRRGAGIRHLEDRRDAAERGGPRAGIEILLVLHARFAEMHLRVDDAGQHMEAGRIDRLGRSAGERSQRSDISVAHANIAACDPVGGGGDAAAHDQVEGLAHGILFSGRQGPVPVLAAPRAGAEPVPASLF